MEFHWSRELAKKFLLMHVRWRTYEIDGGNTNVVSGMGRIKLFKIVKNIGTRVLYPSVGCYTLVRYANFGYQW